MAHLEALRLLDHAGGAALGPDESAHLSGCPRCQERLEKVRAVRDGLREAEPPAAPVNGRHEARLKEQAARSEEAIALADELVRAAASSGEADLFARIRSHPARGYALVYAAQRSARLAFQDPRAALRFAFELQAESRLEPLAPVPRGHVAGEALLLESQALLHLGRPAAALERVLQAREAFRSGRPDAFGEALCDYFASSARAYTGALAEAERGFRSAMKTFAEFGQEHWLGRAELAFGTLLSQRGDGRRAEEYLERGLERLDPAEDASALASGLNNLASTRAHRGERDGARAAYARALKLAHEHGFAVLGHHVQLGLAEIDFLDGRYERALAAYERLEERARERGYSEQVRFALLYVAECEARLGRSPAAALERLRREVQQHRFQSVALEDLFACLDKGDMDEGLIGRVREHLENPRQPYRARCGG